MRHRSYKKSSKFILEKYCQVFINHFNNIYNSDDKYFEAEIWHYDYIIGICFKIIPQKSEHENQIKWIENITTDSLLKKFGLSSLNEELFMETGKKGFEAHAFYVVKHNEYKYWDESIASIDLSEFFNAILEAGAKKYVEQF